MSAELDFNTFHGKTASDLSKFHFRSILNHSLLDLTKSWNITPIDILEKKGKLQPTSHWRKRYVQYGVGLRSLSFATQYEPRNVLFRGDLDVILCV